MLLQYGRDLHTQTYWTRNSTYVEVLYLLAGIAPPDTRRDICARMERTKQMEQETHSLFGHIRTRSRLKSIKDFLTSVKPSYFPAKFVRCNEWQRRSNEKSRLGIFILNEEPAKGYNRHWLTWQCLNRPRTGYTCSKEQRKTWGYINGDITCAGWMQKIRRICYDVLS